MGGGGGIGRDLYPVDSALCSHSEMHHSIKEKYGRAYPHNYSKMKVNCKVLEDYYGSCRGGSEVGICVSQVGLPFSMHKICLIT